MTWDTSVSNEPKNDCFSLCLICILKLTLQIKQPWAIISESVNSTKTSELFLCHCTFYKQTASLLKNEPLDKLVPQNFTPRGQAAMRPFTCVHVLEKTIAHLRPALILHSQKINSNESFYIPYNAVQVDGGSAFLYDSQCDDICFGI